GILTCKTLRRPESSLLMAAIKMRRAIANRVEKNQVKELGHATRQIITGLQARRVGSTYMARCPAHDDRNPSLAIREGNDGRPLVHCHAGCCQADVIAGIKGMGLWPEIGDPQNRRSRRIVATYQYTDERGDLLYEIVRFEHKKFAQLYFDAHRNVVWRKHPRQ